MVAKNEIEPFIIIIIIIIIKKEKESRMIDLKMKKLLTETKKKVGEKKVKNTHKRNWRKKKEIVQKIAVRMKKKLER